MSGGSTPDGKLYDVFLSYNSRDGAAVLELARQLKDAARLRLWLDRWNLVAGEPWQEPVEKALDDSRSCAVFLGPGGIGPWQNEEMRAALQKRVGQDGFRVIPVLLPDASGPSLRELPPFLARLTWVDFRGPEGLGDEAAFRNLVAGIRGHAPGPDEAGPDGTTTVAEMWRRQRRNAPLTILTALLAATSLNLLADVARRFLTDGDHAGAVKYFAQAPLFALQALLLLLLAVSLFEPGRSRAARLLNRAGLGAERGAFKRLLIAAAAAALMLAAWMSLPLVAIHYNNLGQRSRRGDDLTAAARYYRRALSLNPDYAEAHYNLGDVYEHWGNEGHEDEAISEYSRAVRLDGRFRHARNNLARLLIRRGRAGGDGADLLGALKHLDEARNQAAAEGATGHSPEETELLYALYKNLGWARYELGLRDTAGPGYHPAAEEALRHAIALRDRGDEDKGAAAHCLLALVLEAQGKPGALDEWYDCAAYAEGQEDVEPEWKLKADERLRGANP